MLRFITLFLICFSILCSTVQAEDSRDPFIGMQFDLGVPDGIALGIVASPCQYWVKVTGAATSNGVGLGWRLGLILDPIDFGIGPSFTAEYGSYGMFNVSSLAGTDLPDVSYSYINLHGGIEFGDPKSFRFYLKAGPSWLFLETDGLMGVVLEKSENDYTDLSKLSELDATLFVIPTAKLGFTLMFY